MFLKDPEHQRHQQTWKTCDQRRQEIAVSFPLPGGSGTQVDHEKHMKK